MHETEIKLLKEKARHYYNCFDNTAARSLYETISQLDPDDADTWMMLGLIDIETREHTNAFENLQLAIQHNPNLERAHQALGSLAIKQARFADAAQCFSKITSINPLDSIAWRTLGLLKARLSNNNEAEHCIQKAISLSQDKSDTLIDIAENLFTQKSTGLALKICRQVTLDEPDNEAGLFSLCKFLLSAGDHKNTLNVCRLILESDQNSALAYSFSGTALQSQGNLEEAEHCLSKAVDLEPDNATYCYKYACILQTLGKLETAMRFFAKALNSDAGFPAAIAGIVRINVQQANHEKVKELLDPLIETGREEPLVLPTLAYIAPRYGLVGTTIDMIQDAVSKKSIPADLRARLHHALGLLYDSAGKFHSAFRSYSRSKELVPSSYNRDAYSEYISRIIGQFSYSYFNHANTALNNSELPVFIVGMLRSGTSLVEQILSMHKDVYSCGELSGITQVTRLLQERSRSSLSYPECCADLMSAQLDDAANYYLLSLPDKPSTALRITDKMPHNFQHLGLIRLLFPQARIIHIARDPMDTCISCYFQEFSTAHAYNQNMKSLAHHYREYSRLMQHWNSIPALSIMNVQYENLVTNPESTIRDLVRFCGLDWDKNCMKPHENRRTVSTLSSDQVRRPLYTDSIGRWRNYEAFLDVLKEGLNVK